MFGPEYENDLQSMKDKVKEAKVKCYDHCDFLLRMPDEQLPHTGHKTKAEALVYTVGSTQKEVKTLTKAFLKKYPD